MTDPIDRDTALAAIEVLRAREWAAYSWLPAARGKAAFEEAIAALRALPAVSAPTREAERRCETCAAWREYRYTLGHGRCDVCRFSAASFFCAAWEAKEGAR